MDWVCILSSFASSAPRRNEHSPDTWIIYTCRIRHLAAAGGRRRTRRVQLFKELLFVFDDFWAINKWGYRVTGSGIYSDSPLLLFDSVVLKMITIFNKRSRGHFNFLLNAKFGMEFKLARFSEFRYGMELNSARIRGSLTSYSSSSSSHHHHQLWCWSFQITR